MDFERKEIRDFSLIVIRKRVVKIGRNYEIKKVVTNEKAFSLYANDEVK